MRVVNGDAVRWVLIDSCGAAATLALMHGDEVLGREEVVGREFSAVWPSALRGMLSAAKWDVGELEFVGVVHGPGSFTGVRVGLSAAKGLCEATGAALISVSRLEALARLGRHEAVPVLDAGRGEFYVRTSGEERLMALAEAVEATAGHEVVAVEAKVAQALGVQLREVDAKAAVQIVMERWREGAVDDAANIDANYVRGERDIYAKKAAA